MEGAAFKRLMLSMVEVNANGIPLILAFDHASELQIGIDP
jgi:hypothetical protein